MCKIRLNLSSASVHGERLQRKDVCGSTIDLDNRQPVVGGRLSKSVGSTCNSLTFSKENEYFL